ncbi:glycosyltransferase family 1 protein [Pseudoneobacillus sp. C159]
MSKRVLHVFMAMNVGGAETMVMNIYRAIDRNKIQFDFLVHLEEPGYFENEITALGGKIFRIPYPKLTTIVVFRSQLIQLLKDNQYVAVHSHVHSFSGLTLEAAHAVGIPVRIAHSHTTSDGKTQTVARTIYLSMMKYLLTRHTTHRLGCSKDANESLFGKELNADVFPNAFDLQAYGQISTHKTKSSNLVIGHIGRFDRVKNHAFFVKTFYYFRKKHPNATAILVGEGPEKDQIEQLVSEYELTDAVQFLGIQSDIPRILSTFDFFLFPSFYEGLGNVVIEAQAAGVPCLVSTNVPKAVDLSLMLVTFKDLQDGPESWANSLETLMESAVRPSWSERYLNLQQNGYDVMTSAKFLENIYLGS